MNPNSAEVWENREIATNIFRMKLRPYGPVRHVAPGQFFMVGLGQGHDPLLRRPLGGLCVSVNDEGIHLIEFLYEVRGRGTEALALIQPPRIISYIGPLGNGFALYPLPSRLILVAGGMGVVPLYNLVRMMGLRKPRPRLDFIFGARTGRCLALRDELEKMSDRLLICTEDGCVGERGLVTDLLGPALAEGENDVGIMACGPRPMLKAVASLAKSRQAPCQVSLEARMGCGMGACFTCSVAGADGKNRRVCKDGPVFWAEDLDWEAIDDLA